MKVVKIFIIGIMVVVALGLPIGGWFIVRHLNYNLSYKTMVKETIREMVKEEALKNGQK